MCDTSRFTFIHSPSCLPNATSSHPQVTSAHHQTPVDQGDLVDLKEWMNHNVLAKRKDVYYPGIIVDSILPCSVVVGFRHPEGQTQKYQDIFSNGLFDVISDRVPLFKEVSESSSVCKFLISTIINLIDFSFYRFFLANEFV